MAPSVASTRHSRGSARSPWRTASISTGWRALSLDWSRISTSGWPWAARAASTSRANGAITASGSIMGFFKTRSIH